MAKTGTKKRTASATAARLEAFGNKFMQMFDDYDEAAVTTTATREVSNGEEGGASDSDDNEKADQTRGQRGSGGWRSRWAAEFSTDGNTGTRLGAQVAGASSAAMSGGDGCMVVHFRDPNKSSKAESEKQKLARRRFMSCKVDKVHMEAELPAVIAEEGSEEPDMLSREALDEMRREVQELGATALDKKSRKEYENRKLAEIGAKPEKGPRIAAVIGKGMAKKQVERSEKALEEAINAGLVQRKGSKKLKQSLVTGGGSKPRKGGKSGGGGGLNEGLGGRFKDGVLHVGKVHKVDKRRAAKQQQKALQGGKF